MNEQEITDILSNFCDRVREEGGLLYMTNYIHPSCLYLGNEEWEFLKRNSTMLKIPPHDKPEERPRFMSLDVYVVNAKNHFNLR